jgi:DNA-binding response OmpR family regulator
MDGQEVLEKVGSFAPDLILLDLLMPKMSGFQVAEKLKKEDRTKDIPIVVLSAVNDIKEKVDLLGLGIEDYITKPFNFIEIIARIRNILRSKVLKNEIEMRRKDSRLLCDLDAALKQFLSTAEDRAEGILSALASLRKRLAQGSAEERELVDGSLSAAKDLVESVRKLQESHTQFLASQSEELIETRDARS